MLTRWRSLKTEVKVSIVAVIVTVVLGIGAAVQTYLANKPRSNVADVAISAVDVNRTANIDAEWTAEGEGRKGSTKSQGSAVDITLLNSGTAPGLITSADVTFRQVRELENCPHAGGALTLQARYDVKVPIDPSRTKVPFTISRPLRFVVESNRQERLALTIGPEKTFEADWPWFYEVDIALRLDSGKSLDIENVFLLENAYDQWTIFESFGGPPSSENIDCVRNEASFLQQAVDTPGTHSPELLDFNKGIHKYLASISA
jgi:hypothetical protein